MCGNNFSNFKPRQREEIGKGIFVWGIISLVTLIGGRELSCVYIYKIILREILISLAWPGLGHTLSATDHARPERGGEWGCPKKIKIAFLDSKKKRKEKKVIVGCVCVRVWPFGFGLEGTQIPHHLQIRIMKWMMNSWRLPYWKS